MFFILFALVMCFVAGAQALVLLPSERAYDAAALSAIYHKRSRIGNATVDALLDVLEEYSLTEHYGIYALHTHLFVGEEEVLFETQASEANFTSISVLPYASVQDYSVPLTHQLYFANGAVELIPIEHGDATTAAVATRTLLSHAISEGLLQKLAAALHEADLDHAIGLSQVLPIHKRALREGNVVLNQMPNEERQIAVIARELGTASLGLFTRGLCSDGTEIAAGCVWNSTSTGDAC